MFFSMRDDIVNGFVICLDIFLLYYGCWLEPFQSSKANARVIPNHTSLQFGE